MSTALKNKRALVRTVGRIGHDVGRTVPAHPRRAGHELGCLQLLNEHGEGVGLAPADGIALIRQSCRPIVPLTLQHVIRESVAVLLPDGVKPLQERSPVVGTHAFRPSQNAERRGNPHGFVIFPALLVPIQAGVLPVLNDAVAFRVLPAGVFPPRLLHRLPDGLKASCPVQVVEVGGAALMCRAYRQLPADGCSGLARGLDSRIPRCAVRFARLAVIVGAQDDFPVGALLPRHARHGEQVSGIEGHQHGVARREMEGRARGVALGNQQRPVFGAVPCRNGEVPARRPAPGQEPLGTVPGNELEGLNGARRIQHGNHQPPVLRLSQPEGGNLFACKVRVGIRCGVCGLPELPGKFSGLGVPFCLFLTGGFLGFGNTGFQGFTLGGGHVLAGYAAPRPLVACPPVLPPEGSRGVQKRLVRPIRAAWLVQHAATVQQSIRLNALDRKPRFPEPVHEVLENVIRHHVHPRRWDSTGCAMSLRPLSQSGGRPAPHWQLPACPARG